MIILRPASLADAPNLAAFGEHTFCAAFEELYDPDDLRVFLRDVYSSEVVAAEISAERCIHRLAIGEGDEGDTLAGYCKLNYPSDYREHSDASNPIALSQLYIDPARTGKGIGTMLMDWALAYACQRGHDAIQLSVYSENYGAQRFYARYGFAKIADIGFWVGKQRDAEFLYELRLE